MSPLYSTLMNSWSQLPLDLYHRTIRVTEARASFGLGYLEVIVYVMYVIVENILNFFLSVCCC